MQGQRAPGLLSDEDLVLGLQGLLPVGSLRTELEREPSGVSSDKSTDPVLRPPPFHLI